MAREETGVIEHESVQQAVAREEPGVIEHESAQRSNPSNVDTFDINASVEPGVRTAQRSAALMVPVV